MSNAKFSLATVFSLLVGIGFQRAGAAAPSCPGDFAVQVLGSGGPVPEGHRASSGYLIWIKGHSRVLVDAGGGTFLRFGEASAKIEDLSLVAITHFHADHVADLPALIKAGYFSDRTRSLPISGPSGSDEFPSLTAFLHAEFSSPQGAFAYLSGALDGTGGEFKLDPVEVALPRAVPMVVLETSDLTVLAAPVSHGPVPALGYLIRTSAGTIAFSGDQNGNNPVFWEMIQGADILVMHLAISEHPDPVAAKLHALPSVIGKQAAGARVKQLVLSHLMARSLATLPENLKTIRQYYKGHVSVTHDLECFSPQPVAQ
ncbi:MAG: MBL fold metallo-hydrolase [Rudaea sp.]|nr:MBL fold metallo-hydrolase [Rudaea sp.]